MKLSDKILELRKQHGLSQEELAEKLNVSRQAVSRWETGSAQPYASNILQLSKLFGVTADYLLNEDYESDHDVPAVRDTEISSAHKIQKILSLCVSFFGLFGNFVIYILSRFVKVIVPRISYIDGKKWYHYNSAVTGYSYKYFIRTYHLEFLTILFWILFVAGLLAAFINREKLARAVKKICKLHDPHDQNNCQL